MELEILNIIKYLVYVLLSSVAFFYLKKLSDEIKWKHFFVGVLVISMLSYTQFFTLKEDTKTTQNILLQKSKSNTLEDYLSNNKESKEPDFDKFLLEQQKKSNELAKQIEEKHLGENNEY